MMKKKVSTQSVTGAKNIGATIATRLQEIGVYTLADLHEMGPAKAYTTIKNNYPDKTLPVCYYLYSFEGALTDTHWNDIPDVRKEELLKQIER